LAAGVASVFVCLSALFFFPTTALAGEPTKQLKTSIDAVIRILNDKELNTPGNRAKRRSEIRKVVDERFDFWEMARRSMARHWKKISGEEQDEFVPLYADLLVATYIKRIERYQDEGVEYDDEKRSDIYARVKTRIISSERNFEIPVEYRLRKLEARWKVYDVTVEGVSLVNNYRTQFNTIMRSGSFDNLMSRLKAKVEELKQEE
jgi:phospholipid transport system substrate-binding protein